MNFRQNICTITAVNILLPDNKIPSRIKLKPINIHLLLFFCLCGLSTSGFSQMITGVWKGRINRQKVEVKIIRNGDSLTGTSYYYESAASYRRYSIKGYFDPRTNETIWWDDQLLAEKTSRLSAGKPGLLPLLARADFNCPGDGSMKLDGQAVKRDEPSVEKGALHLDKKGTTDFPDEWDFIIDNYTVGANNPDLIDSVAAIAFQQPVVAAPAVIAEPVKKTVTPESAASAPVIQQPAPVVTVPAVVQPTGIVEKFASREKQFVKELTLAGDSIELRFYDNAEIDGDSISLFLNNTLLRQHIRLTANAWTIKLAVNELAASNELVMVAENMGSIPPNTSYMQAIINGQKHEAWLASTEGSSAMIRLVKK